MKEPGRSKFVVFNGGRGVRSTSAAPLPAGNEPFHPAQVPAALHQGREYLLGLQAGEGNWVFAVEADTTIASEYVLLQRFLGRPLSAELRERLGNYLFSRQLPDGGWPLYGEDGFANLSASLKAYWALKLLGHDPQSEPMIRTRQMILSLGGAACCNVFTRFSLALFGQAPWRVTPVMPVEIMLLPRWFFFHPSKISYWARTVMVPLLILYSQKPICRLEPWEGVAELFVTPPDKLRNLDRCQSGQWRKNLFVLLDRFAKRTLRFVPKRMHESALRRAERWTRAHMQGAGGIGAIFPAMANAVMALHILGRGAEDADYRRGLQALDDLLIARCQAAPENEPQVPIRPCGGCAAAVAPDITPVSGQASGGAHGMCQPCASPVWDTCLTMTSLLESGLSADHPAVVRGARWLLAQQVTVKGDWAERIPDLEPGGWAFQFENDLYPDLDDTAKVLMALMRAGALERDAWRPEMARAINWVIGMQSSDGGWGAFDIDNNYLYLNDIPFADHNALLDPSTSDVTGRCVEMLSMAGFDRKFPPMARALAFLRQEQEAFGGWYGRWGVNYIYGTWSALSGLAMAGEDPRSPYIRRAVTWLESVQNPDGGWGETCFSYDDPSLAGRGASTPSQTAWALLGLLAAGEVGSLAARRGVRFLVEHQNGQGGWDERHFTGTGFPRVFYLRYHGYSQYFPLWALGVYERLSAGKATCQQRARRRGPAGLNLPVLERRRRRRW